MLKKKIRSIVAFHTTADAMAFEAKCKAEKVNGKLIPVPRMISAGCGLAYSADPSEKKHLEELITLTGIEPEEFTDCEI